MDFFLNHIIFWLDKRYQFSTFTVIKFVPYFGSKVSYILFICILQLRMGVGICVYVYRSSLNNFIIVFEFPFRHSEISVHANYSLNVFLSLIIAQFAVYLVL